MEFKEFFEMADDFTMRPVGPKMNDRLNAYQKPGWVSFSQTIGGKTYVIGDNGKWHQKVRNKPQPGFIHAFVLGLPDGGTVKNGGVLIRYPTPINFHKVVMPAIYRLVKQLTGLTKKQSEIYLDGVSEEDYDQIQNAYSKYELQGTDFVPVAAHRSVSSLEGRP